MTNATHYQILYADDDADDQDLLSETLTTSGLPAQIICVSNGQEAIHYLEHTPGTKLPALIILDLNMPKLDGRQTLHYIKAIPTLARIPVIMLSTSDNAAEKKQCRQGGAAYCFTKPQHIKGYQNLVQQFKPFIANCP